MIERVQRVTLEGGEGSERERKGHTRSSLSSPGPSQWPSPPSSHRDKEEVGTQERVEAWISLSWTASFFPSRCILLAYPRLHLPSIILHPLPVSLSVYRAPLLRLLFVRHTRFLSFHTPRDSRFPGSFLFLGKPAFNVSPRLNVEGWKHKDGRHGGWECPLTLGIGETEIKKGRNIPRSDFNFRRRRLKRSSTTNASRLFLEIRWIIFVWKKGGGRAFS